MNIKSLCFLSLGLSLTSFAASQPYKAMTLANGLTLVAVEDHKVPLATLVLVCKAGAMTESKSDNGLTHLWEHMFFKGNARLPNQEAFKRRIRELGIQYNGDTADEVVRYYFSLPSHFIRDGLTFMADAISTPLLDRSEIERERKVVLDEYDRNASNPAFDSHNLQRALIYGPWEYKRNPLGRRKIIETATREQLLAIKDRVFVPRNCSLIVAGDIFEKSILSQATEAFSSWKNPEDWKAPDLSGKPPFPKESVDFVMLRPMVQNPVLIMTWDGPTTEGSVQDTYVADVLSTLLQQNSGKFYKSMVDTGLALNAVLSYHTQAHAGEMDLYVQTTPDQVKKARDALAKEPQKWVEKTYFSESSLQRVREQLKRARVFETNKASEFGKELAFWWAVAGLDYHSTYLERLNNVTLDQVRDFVKRTFIGKPYVRSLLLSPEDGKKLNLTDTAGPLLEKHLSMYLEAPR